MSTRTSPNPVIDWQRVNPETDAVAAELEAKIEAAGRAAVRDALKAQADRKRRKAFATSA